MKLDVLQTYLVRLHFSDNEMLKRNGLGKLAASFQAYPINDGGKQLCVLLPNGVTPTVAAKMGGSQLRERVIVLEQGSAKWSKVFPGVEASEAAVKAPAQVTDTGEITIVDDET